MSRGLAVSAVLISGILCLGQQPSSTVKPFVLFEEEQMYGKDSSQPQHTFNRIVARRADGSRMEAFSGTSQDGQTAWSVTIWDVPNGKRMVLEPFTGSVSTSRLSSSEMANELAVQGTCDTTKSEALRASEAGTTLLGYKAVRFVDPEVDEDEEDGFHRETWIARELDCFPLKVTEKWEKHASRNEYTVTKVEEGDPPADLFIVPMEYQERSPGQVEAIYTALYGKEYFGNVVARLDSDYYSHQ